MRWAFSLRFGGICYFPFQAKPPPSQRGDVSHVELYLSTDLQTPQLLHVLKPGQVIKWLYEAFIARLYVPSRVSEFTSTLASKPQFQVCPEGPLLWGEPAQLTVTSITPHFHTSSQVWAHTVPSSWNLLPLTLSYSFLCSHLRPGSRWRVTKRP